MAIHDFGSIRAVKRTARIALLVALAAAPVACGGGAGMAGLPADVQQSLHSLDEGRRKLYLDAREAQEEALEANAALVARAASAKPDELERGMASLNRALLQGRTGVNAVRGGGEGDPVLLRELGKGQSRLREAYQVLEKAHPNPTPNLFNGGLETTQ
jgi:hypothetical protein